MKKFLTMILALIMAMAMAACDGLPAEGTEQPAAQASDAPPAGTPLQGGRLITGGHIVEAEAANLNPFFNTTGAMARLVDIVYERLLFFNHVLGDLEPMLATGFEWSADYRQLTFDIREGVQWHDGQPFTPDDVVFTMEALRDNPALDRFALWQHISDVRALENAVVFELVEPFVSFPFYMDGVRIVPRHIWEGVSDISLELNNSPVGTGPFVLRHVNIGVDVQFEANPYYWDGAPHVDELLFMTFNTAPNLSLSILNGDLHFSYGIAMPFIPELRAMPNSDIQLMSGFNMWAVNINHENEVLACPVLRMAMSMAINQDDLIHRVEQSVVFPTSPGFLPAVFGDYVDQEVFHSLSFNPAGAVELLESAGYERGVDGIFVSPDGQRVSFTYHNAAGAPAQQMAAGMIQQWLLNIGIEIIPRLATWPELTHMLQTGSFQLLQNQIVVPPDPFAALNSVFHSSMTAPSGEATPGLNYFRYRNAEVDALLDEAAVSTDMARRQEIIKEVQRIIAADAVFMPMYNTGSRIPHFLNQQVGGFPDDVSIISNRGLIRLYFIQQ